MAPSHRRVTIMSVPTAEQGCCDRGILQCINSHVARRWRVPLPLDRPVAVGGTATGHCTGLHGCSSITTSQTAIGHQRAAEQQLDS
jgi:hypothetical protein